MTTVAATQVLLHKRALPRAMGSEPPTEVTEALARLPSAFGQTALDAEGANLDIKKLAGQSGFYRLRVGDWRAIFTRAEGRLLVAAIGLRRDVYERVDRMRLGRKGEGVRLIEVAAPRIEEAGVRQRAQATRERTHEPVEQNLYSPFSDAELARIEGVGDGLLAFLRSIPPTVDIGTVLAERVQDPATSPCC